MSLKCKIGNTFKKQFFLFSENVFEQKLFLDADVPSDEKPFLAFQFGHSVSVRSQIYLCVFDITININLFGNYFEVDAAS